jgi:hypothetical protein
MNDDPAAAIDIAEEHGSFLLIRAGSLLPSSKSGPAGFIRCCRADGKASRQPWKAWRR